MTSEAQTLTREAYGTAYEAGRERTVRLLLSRGAQPGLAADVAQSAWLRGWEKLSQLRNPQMVLTWVNSIALNQYRRLASRENLHQEIRESDHGKVCLSLAPIDVQRILSISRPVDRQMLEAQIKGLTAKEIARKQGLSETAIRLRFLRARRSARKALEVRRKDLAEAYRRGTEGPGCLDAA